MSIGRAVLVAGFFLTLALFLSLAEWQLRRAAEKTLLFDQIGRAEYLPVLTTAIDGERLDEYRYRWLDLRGRYDSSRQLLLDSMIHEGQAGYHVLTPFRLLGDERWLLVNRGWVRADADRQVRPQIDVSEEVREIRGQISALPRPGLRLPRVSANEAQAWPQVLLYPDFDELEALLGMPLLRYQLWLGSENSDGFVRAWEPSVLAPEQHVGYAMQWFGLAVVLVVMTVIVGVSSVRRARD